MTRMNGKATIVRRRLRETLVCSYCRDTVDRGVAIECGRSRCGARYHDECWQECFRVFGGCAVLGCVPDRSVTIRPPSWSRGKAWALASVILLLGTTAGSFELLSHRVPDVPARMLSADRDQDAHPPWKTPLEHALHDIDRDIRLHPKDATNWYNRACSHEVYGDPDSMIRDLERFLELEPDGPLAASVRSKLERAKALQRARSGPSPRPETAHDAR